MYYIVDEETIYKANEGKFIPMYDRNHDYELYKSWLADGNTPLQFRDL